MVRQPTFDLDELGDDPEQFIADYAAKLVLAGANADQNSPLETAKREVMESSARAVVGQARAIIPVVIDSLQPKLAEVAEDFISAVNALPENLTAEALVQAGARSVEAYQRATGLADQLRRYDELVVSTGEIQGVLPTQYERTLRLLVAIPRAAVEARRRRGPAPWQPGGRPARLAVLHRRQAGRRLRAEVDAAGDHA